MTLHEEMLLEALEDAEEWFIDYETDYPMEPTEPTALLITKIRETIKKVRGL